MKSCPEVFELPPLWFAPASNFILFLTVPASIYTAYLIAAVTPPHTDFQYKMFLLIYHMISSFYSVFNALTMLVQYMPAMLFIEIGMLQMSTFMFILTDLFLQGLVLMLSILVLLYRFSIVIYGVRKKETIQTVLIISATLYVAPQILLLIYVANLNTPADDKKKLLKDCPQMKPLTDLYEPIYVNNSSFLKMAASSFTLVAIASIICFVIVLMFCYVKLKEKAQFLADTTKKLQTRLLVNLVITVSIPWFSHALPATAGTFIVSLNLQVPIWIPTVLWSMGSLHGMMNCIVFISLNEYYFNQMKKDLQKMTVFINAVLPGKRITSETQTEVF